MKMNIQQFEMIKLPKLSIESYQIAWLEKFSFTKIKARMETR